MAKTQDEINELLASDLFKKGLSEYIDEGKSIFVIV